MKTFKINFLLFGFCFLFSSVLQAQTKDANQNKTMNDEIFVVVENNPEFPGGEQARLKFFQKNLVYPKAAKEKEIQGKVIISFIVEKDGSITNIKVEKGVDSLLDAEALRVVKLMPKWKPGTQRGIPVRCSYRIPVVFVLQ